MKFGAQIRRPSSPGVPFGAMDDGSDETSPRKSPGLRTRPRRIQRRLSWGPFVSVQGSIGMKDFVLLPTCGSDQNRVHLRRHGRVPLDHDVLPRLTESLPGFERHVSGPLTVVGGHSSTLATWGVPSISRQRF